jgi:SAM-dependent methyltransferase
MAIGRLIDRLYTRWHVQRKEAYFNRKIASYIHNGQKPWSEGYQDFKWQFIERIIADPEIIHIFANRLELPANYGQCLDERVIEYPWMISRLLKDTSGEYFLDAGSSLNYACLIEHPRLANQNLYCLTLAPEENCFWQQGVSYVFADLRNTPFKDNFFDRVISISTLEHIGMNNQMLYTSKSNYQENKPQDYLTAIREIKRILKKGHQCLITLPFGRSQYDVFQQQFDATMLDRLKQEFAPIDYQESFYQYHEDGWHLSTQKDCLNCQYFNFHSTKYCDPESKQDYDLDMAAAARAVVVLEMTK